MSSECSVQVENSTVFVTAIENIKDGVAGTTDDTTFDYNAMRRMTDAMVTVVVDLEGKTSKTVQMPIRIQHDSLPFMVCDLSNEHASVAWNTKEKKYIGFPIETKVCLYYQNSPYTISDLNITVPTGLKASMSISGKAKVITIEQDELTVDSLPSVMKLPITVVGVYAGARYEYTKELTVVRSADTVVYEVVPSVSSISLDKDGKLSATNVACRVYATSSDDKRYEISSLPSGFSLKYSYTDTPNTAIGLGSSVTVTADRQMVTFGLYDGDGTELDRETVPVVKDGKYAPKASSDDDIITVPTDSNGNALAAFSETITLSLMVDAKACNVSSVSITKNGLTNASCTVSGNMATVACAKGAALGKSGQTLILKVTGTKDGTEYSDYVTVKLVPNVTGEDGDGYEYVYYRSNSSSTPSAPKRSGGTLTSGWYDDPMATTDTYQYVYVAYKTGEIGSDGTFSTPVLFSRYPKSIDYETTKYYTWTSGKDAPDSSTIWSSGTTDMPTDFNDSYPWLWKLTRTFYTDGTTHDTVVCIGYKGKDGEDGKDGTDGKDGADGNGISSITTYYLLSASSSGVTTSTSGWSTASTKPTEEKPYLWSYTKTVYTKSGTYSTSPVIVGNYAKAGAAGQSITGPRGPIPRTHGSFESGSYTYQSGATGEDYVDLVYINNVWYRCKSTYTTSSPTVSDGHWEQSQTTGWTFMATKLMLAEQALVQNLRVEDVYITEKGNGEGNIVLSANKNGITCNQGTFNNVTVTGTINASSGQIGDFTLTSTALTTTIKGVYTTTSGGLFKDGSFWVRNKPVWEVAIGSAASTDPTRDSSQQACDMYGTSYDNNATDNIMIVRKYTKGANIGSSASASTSVNNPAYAALSVDTDEGPGIRSIGANLFGSIAQSVIRTSSLTSSHTTAINNNRVGVVVMTNSSQVTVSLPSNPMTGQMFTVIRQGSGNVLVSGKNIVDVGSSSLKTSVLVETLNNWARFLWDGSSWNYERSFYS